MSEVKKIRVVEYCRMSARAGIENFLMNIYRNIDHTVIQMDFLRPCKIVGPYDQEILSSGGKIYYLPESSRSVFALINQRREFKKFLEENKDIDIIHFHGNGAISLLNSDIAKKKGIKCIIGHSHNNGSGDMRGLLIHKLLKFYLRKSFSNRLACSKSAWKWMFYDASFNKSKDYVFNNGIKVTDYLFSEERRKEIRKELNLKSSDIVIGSVGRLTKQKNYEFIVGLLPEVIKKNNDVKLVIVGDGELKFSLMEQVKLLGLSEYVIFTGMVTNVSDYLSAFDTFILPSLWEGFGICLIEAQASGLPCVVSDKIVDEVIITNLVRKIDLNLKEKWINVLSSLPGVSTFERMKYNVIVEKSGFDIEDTTKWIENFYIDNVINEMD